MKNKTKLTLSMLMISCFLILGLSMVSADTCVGQDCSTNMTITVGNEVPTIAYVYPEGAVTLTGGSTKVVTLEFNATDPNGVADLNDATAQVVLSKAGETSRTSPSCSTVSSSATVRQYSCDVTMQFYDGAGSWTINATVEDQSAAEAVNDTTSVTVNALDFITQDILTITWGSVSVGQTDAEADAKMVLTNGGNQDYSDISIKGQNATGVANSEVITTDLFSISNLGSQTSGQTYMVDNTYTSVPALSDLNAHGAAVTQDIYFYLDVPIVQSDTYLSDSDWSILATA